MTLPCRGWRTAWWWHVLYVSIGVLLLSCPVGLGYWLGPDRCLAVLSDLLIGVALLVACWFVGNVVVDGVERWIA